MAASRSLTLRANWTRDIMLLLILMVIDALQYGRHIDGCQYGLQSGAADRAASGALGPRSEQVLNRHEGFRHDTVVDPATSAFMGQEAGIFQHLEVMAHGRLAQPQWLGKMAHTRFTLRLGLDQAEQSDAGRIGHSLERRGQLLGVRGR